MIGEPVFAALAQSTELFDMLGMLAFALAGILAAQGRDVDPVGVFIVAFTSAFGGLTVRDLILDLRPVCWISHEAVIWVILFFTIFAPAIVKRFSTSAAREVFLIAEAAGLGIFCASGTVLAWERGIAPLSCTIVGVATGISGGILRDVLLRRIPAALSDRQPYGLAAFIGCWLAVILLSDGVRTDAVVAVTALSILAIRVFTLKVNWEIRYRSALAARIFPGRGTLSGMLRRGARASKAAKTPSAPRLRRVRPAAPDRAEPIRTEELIKRRKPANLPSAGSPKDDES